MDLFEAIKLRYSVRAYQHKPIEEEHLKRILEAANDAPSAGNRQAFEVIVIRDEVRKEKLAAAALDQWFIEEAPVVLAFFANPERNKARYGERGEKLYSVQDGTIACAYAQLAATSLGLGTCWVSAFDDEEVSRICGAPESWKPLALVPIGYSADEARPRQRRPLDNLVHKEQARK